MFAWGGWSAISVPTPLAYRVLDISPCGGDATCFRTDGSYASGWPLVTLIALCALYLVGVFIVQRGLTGRTVGSMLFMVEVVGEDLQPIGVVRASLRSLAGAIDYLPCCIPIVGIVTIAATPSHQRIGDLAAGSIVVEARRSAVRAAAQDRGEAHSPAIGPRPVDQREQLPVQPPTERTEAPPVPPGPLWDPSRRAYVLWDDQSDHWLIFDEPTQQWIRLHGE